LAKVVWVRSLNFLTRDDVIGLDIAFSPPDVGILGAAADHKDLGYRRIFNGGRIWIVRPAEQDEAAAGLPEPNTRPR
jgi:hypothetical protein